MLCWCPWYTTAVMWCFAAWDRLVERSYCPLCLLNKTCYNWRTSGISSFSRLNVLVHNILHLVHSDFHLWLTPLAGIHPLILTLYLAHTLVSITILSMCFCVLYLILRAGFLSLYVLQIENNQCNTTWFPHSVMFQPLAGIPGYHPSCTTPAGDWSIRQMATPISDFAANHYLYVSVSAWIVVSQEARFLV